MLNTDNTDVTIVKSELWLMCRPGHILFSRYRHHHLSQLDAVGTDLLPYPNAAVEGSLIAGFNWPSFRKRSGLKKWGSGYISGS